MFPNPLGSIDSVPELISAIVQAVVIVATPFVILFLIYAGFLFVTAQGNEEKLNTAKKVLLWTIVGGLLVLGAEALVIALQGTIEQISR